MAFPEPSPPWENNNGAATATEAPATDPQPEAEPSTDDSERAQFDRAWKTAEEAENPEDGVETAEASDDAEPEKTEDVPATQDQPEPEQPAFKLSEKASQYAEELGLDAEDRDALLDRALLAYRRDDTFFDDDEVFERFNKNPDLFIEKGLKRAKVQKDGDTYKQNLERQKQQPEQTSGDGKPVPLPEAIKEEIGKVLEPLAGDEIFKDLQEPLAIGFTTIAEKIAGHFNSEREELLERLTNSDSRVQQLQNALVTTQIDQTLSRLSNTYPRVNDSDIRQEINEMYDTLMAMDAKREQPKFTSVDQVATAAVKAVLGEESTNDLKKNLLKRFKAQKNGTPSKPKGKPEKRTLSEEDKMRAEFDRIAQKHSLPE